MLFNSYEFIFIFFPIALIGYYLFNHFRYYKVSNVWLCMASLFFYGSFDWFYFPVILISIIANFFISFFIRPHLQIRGGAELWRRILLVLGLLGNLGILFYFKYYDFLIDNLNKFMGTHFALLNLLLPLGISFFTFQQISYLLDCFYGSVPRCTFFEYALFVSFFPQLIAGPIVLYNEMFPQFTKWENRRFQIDNFVKGLNIFSIGMAKKVLLADTFSEVVDVGFSNIEYLGTANALIVMLCYTFQIYFDFSGYCDMAVGIGKFFNINLPLNFISPYRARTITEFWKRWHITLTRFFTTYIYIPLGGNQKGKLRTYCNIMIVFVISGIWHGADWSFILWGIMHGIAFVITKTFERYIQRWNPVFSWLCTFAFVNVSWIFFRADTISQAIDFIQQITSFKFRPILNEITTALVMGEIRLPASIILGEKVSLVLGILFLMFALYACLRMKNVNEQLKDFRCTLSSAVLSGLLMIWSVISLSGVSVFLYWNF